ncbi:undecaprenyl-phosphate glucose phosphotransferase [Pseudomonas vancouverensis]|uniref:Undecaprenyl-phosphate glucose phosphotransferase n=1 Tax=Pseudomonas vancouverensis TaxID=95300 RepID=A0A1H2NFI0_PSEVA|nr:undecaprenyl-phosphate glucose phosphotransferase [Pseudomonas vancouverensis]KAB0494297.1 undecaprenyl-phosphate glucose phosphotransferase [Pseudomonas vancouverensis]TDB60605.1 undecaprenyl-phosphate glucose phosphotransferase [Pseudomonas vancouverensis]SDV04124.1 putative colanic acid biosysnthesis UDP-glucose lipid carrier transferase [Pseudomonas vancouverensis]
MTPLYTAQMAHRRGVTFWGQWVCAMALVNLLLVALVQLRVGGLPSEYRLLMILTVLGSVPIYSLMQVYYKRHGLLVGLSRLLAGWLILLGVLISIAFVTQTSALFSRQVIIVWAITGFLAQAASFLPLHYVARLYSRMICHERRSVIIGTCPTAHELAKKLTYPNRALLLGFIAAKEQEGPAPSILPLLGHVNDIRELITRMEVRRVYIVLPMADAATIEALYIDLLDMNVDVVWIPDFGSMVLLNHSISEIERMPAIYLNESLITSHPGSLFCKDLFERTLAAVALMVLSPLLLCVALAVKLTSPGPVLFKQNRHGCDGQVIKVWKFRSMRVHNDQEVRQATRDDDRVTPLGRFLRRSSIDELPQLFNVLFGQMALVGPRPHAVTHNIYYTGKVRAYMARHRLKPGITGLAQITGHRGETETLEKMQLRVAQDLNYINQWSLWLDIKILLKTPFTLFSKNIY